jgi:hypothetical protein
MPKMPKMPKMMVSLRSFDSEYDLPTITDPVSYLRAESGNLPMASPPKF